MKKIDRKSITICNLMDSQRFIILVILLISITVSNHLLEQYKNVNSIVIFLFIIFAIIFIIKVINNFLLYENSRYHLNNEILFIKKSGVTSLESTIPLKRIQHVDIEQTLYSRFFNLYQLNIYTAGDKNNIGFIRKEEAESMKNDITEYLLGMSEEVDG